MRVIAALAIAAAVLAPAPAARGEEPAPSITVLGSGTVSGRPDMAEITTGVVTQSATAAQALAENTAAMGKVLKAVADLGVADRDVQTTGVSVVPQRAQPPSGRPQPTPIVAYEVTNQIHVKVRDLARLGTLLDALVGQGANALGGVSLSIAEPGPLLEQARALAVRDARRRAEVYAAAAGVKLGAVLFIRDTGPGTPRPVAARMMAAGPVPIAVGEQQVEASVSVTWALQ